MSHTPSLSPAIRPKSLTMISAALLAGLTIAACTEPTGAPVEAPAPIIEAPVVTASPAELHATRIADLQAVHAAIEAYYAANGSYPDTQLNWRGVAFGHAPGAPWIPGLSPDYIEELPRDPLLGETKEEPQYIYISDGTGYKLIVHNATDLDLLDFNGDILIDPRRPETGYGYWTAGLVDY